MDSDENLQNLDKNLFRALKQSFIFDLFQKSAQDKKKGGAGFCAPWRERMGWGGKA